MLIFFVFASSLRGDYYLSPTVWRVKMSSFLRFIYEAARFHKKGFN